MCSPCTIQKDVLITLRIVERERERLRGIRETPCQQLAALVSRLDWFSHPTLRGVVTVLYGIRIEAMLTRGPGDNCRPSVKRKKRLSTRSSRRYLILRQEPEACPNGAGPQRDFSLSVALPTDLDSIGRSAYTMRFQRCPSLPPPDTHLRLVAASVAVVFSWQMLTGAFGLLVIEVWRL